MIEIHVDKQGRANASGLIPGQEVLLFLPEEVIYISRLGQDCTTRVEVTR